VFNEYILFLIILFNYSKPQFNPFLLFLKQKISLGNFFLCKKFNYFFN